MDQLTLLDQTQELSISQLQAWQTSRDEVFLSRMANLNISGSEIVILNGSDFEDLVRIADNKVEQDLIREASEIIGDLVLAQVLEGYPNIASWLMRTKDV